MPPTSTPERKKVPSKAMRFDAGQLQFADGGSDTNTTPIKMLGRSAEPIYHWYWGKIVHDMAGFKTDHAKVPVDWNHDGSWEEGIGYLDTFKADNKGLFVEGQLVSVDEKDRAATIMKKSAAGVPYQASIFFRPERIERVEEGAKATVNGLSIEGPAYIVREWALRGMAVCLYGADHRTHSQFSDGDEVAVDIFSLESQMPPSKNSETQSENKLSDNPGSGNATKPADKPESTETKLSEGGSQETPATPATQLSDKQAALDELKRYVDAFGAENGAKWLMEGVEFSDAQKKHVDVLNAQLKAKDEQIEGLNKKLSSIDRGEPKPAEFNDADKPAGDKQTNNRFAHLGDKLSTFAQSIKLPGKPSDN